MFSLIFYQTKFLEIEIWYLIKIDELFYILQIEI